MKLSALLGALLYFGSVASHAWAEESPLIRSVQDISLSSLDSAAPNVTLSQWLSRLGGVPSTALDWEINDCGEGGDGRSHPTCVEGRINFGSGRSVGVSVAVATTEGKTGGKLSIFMMYAREGDKVEFARSIRELELIVAKLRK